jgi:hypothetical protein
MLVLLFVATGLVYGRLPSTQPVDVSAPLDVRAQEEFNAGKWTTALPLLKKLAIEVKTDPDRLGQVQEQIRVCEKNMNIAAQQAAAGPQAPAVPTSADQRKPHDPPKPGEVREMEIKELGNFDYDAEKGGNIPDDVKKLTGMDVKLKGFMIPMDQASSITQFALVPSLFSCCFGQPPQIQHTIIVKTPAGKGVSYYPDEIVVQGKLNVEEKREDGFIVSVFDIACDSVKPAAK